MKIIFLGTPEIATPTLKELIENQDIEVIAAISQPDKKVGRKQLLTPPPVKILASDYDIPVHQPENTKELYEILKNYEVDFLIVFAFGMILNEKILQLPKIAAVNIHTSLLPKYRGASPIQEALKNGDKETGITIMKIVKRLDAGPIFKQETQEIVKDDNAETLSAKLATLSSKTIVKTLNQIERKQLIAEEQDENQATHCKKITKDDGKIDFTKTALEIHDMIRAYTPWPGCHTIVQGKRVKIVATQIETPTSKHTPGTFFEEEKILKIATTQNLLIPTQLQIEGKKIMTNKDFLNSHKSLLPLIAG